MTQLSEFISRLEAQFLDPYQVGLSQAAKTEAFRSSLASINSLFSAHYDLAGLNGAALTSLPEEFFPALERGAAGNALQMVLQNKFGSYSNLPLSADEVGAWVRYLFQERDALLDRLRLANLHRSSNLPWGQWPMEERGRYD